MHALDRHKHCSMHDFCNSQLYWSYVRWSGDYLLRRRNSAVHRRLIGDNRRGFIGSDFLRLELRKRIWSRPGFWRIYVRR